MEKTSKSNFEWRKAINVYEFWCKYPFGLQTTENTYIFGFFSLAVGVVVVAVVDVVS